MVVIDFRLRRTADQLAVLLGCDPELIPIINHEDRLNFYTKHPIPKRNGRGHRITFEPNRALATVQKGFLSSFKGFITNSNCIPCPPHPEVNRFNKWQANQKIKKLRTSEKLEADVNSVTFYPHPAVHGFNQGSSTKTNAHTHCGAKRLLRLDIRNFFQSISRSRIEHMFEICNVHKDIIPWLSGLVTVPDYLPEGLTTSPLISNLVSLPIDLRLHDLATNNGVRYTRYADDITFSSHGSSGQLPSATEISEILSEHGHELAEEKTRTTVPGYAHFVTGLSVQLPDRPTVPKKIKRRLRQELYYIEKFGFTEHVTKRPAYRNPQHAVNVIDGLMNYVNGIEANQWKEQFTRWRALMKTQGVYPTYQDSAHQLPSTVTALVDESLVNVNGTQYFALAAVEFPPVLGLNEKARNALRLHLEDVRKTMKLIAENYYKDPFSSGGTDHLRVTGLHHCDDPMDLQTEVIEYISGLPIQIYIAYQIHDSQNYAEIYTRTIKSLLRGRISARRSDNFELIIEKNSHVADKDIANAIRELKSSDTNELTSGGTINPIFAYKKEEPLLAIADYALGVFFAQRKAKPKRESDPLDILVIRFERLRHRYRYITNLSAGLRFNRRNPLNTFNQGFK